VSRGSSTTSPGSRRPRSSGSEGPIDRSRVLNWKRTLSPAERANVEAIGRGAGALRLRSVRGRRHLMGRGERSARQATFPGHRPSLPGGGDPHRRFRSYRDGRLRHAPAVLWAASRRSPVAPSDRGAPCVNPLRFYFFIINIAYNAGGCDKTQSILNRHIYFYYILSWHNDRVSTHLITEWQKYGNLVIGDKSI
jgi:hypothetical protein